MVVQKISIVIATILMAVVAFAAGTWWATGRQQITESLPLQGPVPSAARYPSDVPDAPASAGGPIETVSAGSITVSGKTFVITDDTKIYRQLMRSQDPSFQQSSPGSPPPPNLLFERDPLAVTDLEMGEEVTVVAVETAEETSVLTAAFIAVMDIGDKPISPSSSPSPVELVE
jgi:hypothetical protein